MNLFPTRFGKTFFPVFFLSMAVVHIALAITPAEEPVVAAVSKTLPTVVNINTEGVVTARVQDPFDIFFDRFQTRKQQFHSLGSGVLISPDGYIVTNAHVIERAQQLKIQVTLTDGSVYTAKLLSRDPDQDLALIKIEDKKPLPFLDLKNLSPNLLGETVIALGNPIGYQSSVSQGILSAKNRTVKVEGGTMDGLLQTDAGINPGNSGGPLVDINGNFVGLNSAKAYGQAVESIGFAIPGNVVAAWVSDAIAIAKGEKKAPAPVSLTDVLKKRFGVTLQDVTPELAQEFGFSPSSGLLVSDVEAGSPADQAKIKRGMLLIRIGDMGVVDSESLPREIAKLKTGDHVIFTVSVVQTQGGFILRRSGQVELVAR